jgi:hypothetical protein
MIDRQTVLWYLLCTVKAEGIFRLSGSATEIAEYKRKYDAGM